MYKIVIIYNDNIELINIENYLTAYKIEHNVEFEIVKYDSEEKYFESKDAESDFILIEIAIPKLNGMAIASKIRQMRPEVPIAFFCNSAQFSLSCYEYGAVGYLLKPIQKQAFFACLKRGIFIMRRLMRRKVRIKGTNGVAVVKIIDISYVEIQKHNLLYHLHPKCEHRQKIIQVRGRMADAESLLLNFEFARCGVSYLVNLQHVLSIINNSVYLSETALPISRAYKTEFLNKFVQYLSEREVRNL